MVASHQRSGPRFPDIMHVAAQNLIAQIIFQQIDLKVAHCFGAANNKQSKDKAKQLYEAAAMVDLCTEEKKKFFKADWPEPMMLNILHDGLKRPQTWLQQFKKS